MSAEIIARMAKAASQEWIERGGALDFQAMQTCAFDAVPLIAAAPDLLAALKKWAKFCADNYSDEDITWAAETRAAIAKAEGKLS